MRLVGELKGVSGWELVAIKLLAEIIVYVPFAFGTPCALQNHTDVLQCCLLCLKQLTFLDLPS